MTVWHETVGVWGLDFQTPTLPTRQDKEFFLQDGNCPEVKQYDWWRRTSGIYGWMVRKLRSCWRDRNIWTVDKGRRKKSCDSVWVVKKDLLMEGSWKTRTEGVKHNSWWNWISKTKLIQQITAHVFINAASVKYAYRVSSLWQISSQFLIQRLGTNDLVPTAHWEPTS